MASDYLKANWKQIRGAVKMKWGDLKDDDIAKAEGQRELLEGLLQEKYGYSKEVAQKQLDDLLSGFKGDGFKGGNQGTADFIKGNWNQVKGAIKYKWGDLSDNDVAKCEARQGLIEALLQEKYGYTKAVAKRKLQEVLDAIKEGGDKLKEKVTPEKTPAHPHSRR